MVDYTYQSIIVDGHDSNSSTNIVDGHDHQFKIGTFYVLPSISLVDPIMLKLIGVAALGLLSSVAACPQPHVYLSPNGSDAYSGCTASEAVLTPAHAQQLARVSHGAAEPFVVVTVWVAGGTYELAAPLELSSADSHTTWRRTAGDGLPYLPVFSAGPSITNHILRVVKSK